MRMSSQRTLPDRADSPLPSLCEGSREFALRKTMTKSQFRKWAESRGLSLYEAIHPLTKATKYILDGPEDCFDQDRSMEVIGTFPKGQQPHWSSVKKSVETLLPR